MLLVYRDTQYKHLVRCQQERIPTREKHKHLYYECLLAVIE